MATQQNLIAFCTHALAPRSELPAAHHQRIVAELENVARGEVTRLMILAPPGSAKTSYASRLFPAWYLVQPNRSVIGASHTADGTSTMIPTAISGLCSRPSL